MKFLILQMSRDDIANDLIEDLERVSSESYWKSLDIREILLNILIALVIYVIGYIVIKIITYLISKLLGKTKITTSGIYYIDKVVKFILYFILIMIIANNLGIKTGSLVALIASLGLAIALALQGSLSDLASGIMIIIARPIRVGDYVYLEGIGDLLYVKEIKLFNTILRNRRNIDLIVSNKEIMTNRLENVSTEEYVLADVFVSVSYNSDISKVKKIISNCLDNINGVLSDKKYLIGVNKLDDSGVEMLVSAPCLAKDHSRIRLIIREEILKALLNEGIEIPFPQLEVNILNEK